MSVVQDTINEVKETLKNVRMTKHARKLFETSQVDRKSKKLKSSTKTKEVKPALKQKNVLNIESNPADTEQITKIASDKLSPKKSPLKSGILETSFEESSIIPDSDTEEAENNLKFNFVPEISSHLKQTPLGKKLAGNQKTPISRRVQKNDDNFDQSNNDEEENVDLMSPVISQVKVQPSRKTIESLKTELSQTTRLRTRSLTETESDKLGLDKKSSKLSSRKSITGYKPVVMDESLQMEPIEETKTANLTQNNSDTANKNTEHDVIVGGYSLRQTRKRTLSEASNSSVMSHQSVTEKIEKTKKPAKTPKSKTKTKIDDVVLIEMSDSETSSPKKKPESTTKTIKMRIGDIDITEMSDSEGLSPEDVEENTSDKTLLKVDNEITFSMEKTKDQKKSSRRLFSSAQVKILSTEKYLHPIY
ncbi:hypothetical protein KUTeg_010186 [Tegillarca granosa]|uniref:Uncharacterized protein n=1 Tax=Tegillarca granosa TaxID=220873 RepID=A0ABQ9F621_TEGGR|nr:hypothetical protein KUTeg_010186 [Tegillarca granosa]